MAPVAGPGESRLMQRFRFITLLLVLLALCLTGTAAGYSIDILESDHRGFRFVATIDSGAVPSAEDLSQTVTVALPYGSTVSLIRSGGAGSRPLPSSVTQVEEAPLVELSRPYRIRGRQLVNVVLNPVRTDRLVTAFEVELAFNGGMTLTGFTVPDPRFDRIFSSLAANWDQARRWPKPARALARVSQDGSLSQVTDWYKIEVDRTGLTRITGAELQQAGMPLVNVSTDRLRLFNGGGRQLPVRNSSPRPTLDEIALMIHDGGDGVFDASDTLYLYGQSLNRWTYEAGQPPEWVHHHYDDKNVYWLTIDEGLDGTPARMGERSGTPGGVYDTLITSFMRPVRMERDSLFKRESDGHIQDYYHWYWTDHRNPTVFAPLVNLVADGLIDVRVAAWTHELWPDTLFDLDVNGAAATRLDCSRRSGCSFVTADLQEGINQLSLSFGGSGAAAPFLDYIEFSYGSLLKPTGDEIEFHIDVFDSSRGRIELVDDFSTTPLILDLSQPRAPIEITDPERGGGVFAIKTELSATSVNRYLVTSLAEAESPATITRSTVTDLRQIPAQADLIIVAADHLVDALNGYITDRRADGYTVHTVTTEDIYDNFAWGLTDPTAVRDYLKFAYESYPAPVPSTVLLVGDGSYDFLGIANDGVPNYVPPYINEIDSSHTYGDDNYVYFGRYGYLDSDSSYVKLPDRGWDMMTARWPVRTATEVTAIVDKIRRYRRSTGAWRTRAVMVADDEFAGGRTNEMIHTSQTEVLADVMPPYLNLEKVYAIEHEKVNRYKLTVNDAIVEAVNKGCILVNYVGHGNPLLWAHEHIFTSAADVPRLNNYDQLPVFFAASCAIGFFDDPEQQGMAEVLLTKPDGGAAAVISATRLVYSGRNHAFNRAVYEYVFDGDSLTLAQAVFAAKIKHQYSGSLGQIQNDRSYVLFGDPCLPLRMPESRIEFQSPIDTLVALQPVSVSGRIVDSLGAPLYLDGEAEVRVFDSDRRKTYISTDHGGSWAYPFDYTVDGPVIYRGSVPVESGEFEFTFVAPLDIGYGGRSARVQIYAALGQTDAVGTMDSIAVADSVGALTDSIPPQIAYGIAGRDNFVSGDVVSAEDRLVITITDSSGINLTEGLGHGIVLTIDDEVERTRSLTDLFQYDSEDYTTGKLEYSLDSLSRGEHRLKIKAWDNANNSATAELDVVVQSGSDVVIRDLLNYPNPMQDSTSFGFQAHVPLDRFELEIFTLAGRRIQSYSLHSLPAGYHNELVWRGEDFVGDRVATGVYIYRATASPQGGGAETELFGKVVVVN